eukprot:TRINITY_DN16498_c0_g1_i1.p1 TRINITY_DN16498_c0_g1~~TRINITY_DN16498_c0_g1_i1.p1  ORF type:complete len:464 (+),score=73.42 TRINITY_DN16498_c0_g1_i1:123-1514(+)
MTDQEKTKRPFDDEPNEEEEEEGCLCGICQDVVETRGLITTRRWGGQQSRKTRGSGCGHLFCYECILLWSKKSSRCPMCRKNFNSLYKLNAKTDKTVGAPRKIRKQEFEVSSDSDSYSSAEGGGGAYPDSDDDWAVCHVCGACDNEPELLTCSSCDNLQHAYCITPAVDVKKDDVSTFQCSSCRDSKKKIPPKRPPSPQKETEARPARAPDPTRSSPKKSPARPNNINRNIAERTLPPKVKVSEDYRKGSDKRMEAIAECCSRLKAKNIQPANLKENENIPALLEELGYTDHLQIVRLQMWISSGYFDKMGGDEPPQKSAQQKPPTNLRDVAAKRIQKAGAICTNVDALFRTIRLIRNDTKLSASLSEGDFRSLFEEVLPAVPLCRSVEGSFNVLMSKLFGDVVCNTCTFRNPRGCNKCETCGTPLDLADTKKADLCPVCSIAFADDATQEDKHTHVNLHFTG